MGLRDLDNILVVYKKSLFELYTSGTADDNMRNYALNNSALLSSHNTQQKSIEAAVKAVEHKGLNYQLIYRGDLTQDIADKYSFVISVGGDGTLLDVSHFIKDTPILGLNSDPNSSIGYFCLATPETISHHLSDIETVKTTKMYRLQLILNDNQIPIPALNDILLTPANPAEMMRYKLTVDGVSIQRKGSTTVRSSGIIICTAAGSTGWMYQAGGKIMPPGSKQMQYHERDQRELGFNYASEKIVVESETRVAKIYVDGSHIQYDFNLGAKLTVTMGQPLILVGDLREKRRKNISERDKNRSLSKKMGKND
ncbi:MAG TPA: NAD(+)/NADH kinase [Candidatus Nanoarchaeia archaeon]|nr:NAD(+)/NADH kinase [Candidatus Nanoarchaeia archaeon]